jgi:hypothetical protein
VTDPLPDAKGTLTDRWDRCHLDVVHASTGRALPTPRGDSVDRCLGSLDLQFDRAVAAVAHPSRDTLGARNIAARIPEEHTLDTSRHDDTNAYGTAGRYTWHASQKNVERLENRARRNGRRQR